MSEQVEWKVKGRLTQEVIEKQRQKVGMKLRLPNVRSEHADPGNAIAFSNAIGDSNPLWRDADYARNTRYKAAVAHPAYLNVRSSGEVVQGMPGITGFHAGTRWEFYRPVYIWDKFQPECTFSDFREKKGGFAPRWFMEYYDTLYYNQLGELVAKSTGTMARVERRVAKSDAKRENNHPGITVPHPWTHEERRNLEHDMLTSEVIRGSTPRYWEDIAIGDELPAMVIGPLRMGDVLAWLCTESLQMTRSTQVAVRTIERHPGLAMLHPDSNAMELITMVHWDNTAARSMGQPGAYDIGGMRQAYMMRYITNWMGDDGFLKVSDCQYRRFVYIGDAIWLNGRIEKKYIDDDGDYCVDIITSCTNQRNENVMPGLATVALPSRENHAWPVDRVARKM